MQDTGKFRQNTKDQFYTKEAIAKECVDDILSLLPETKSWFWIEPSAGAGAFVKAAPSGAQIISIDIEPKYPNTIEANFLEKKISSSGLILVFGNPPFGSQGSLAKAFIKHSVEFANVIAFILPRSFQKPSMNRVFPPYFHCILSKEIKENSFEVNGKDYNVPCVFQIWQKKAEPRPLEEILEANGFRFVKNTETHDLIIRRVGMNAGQANILGDVYNPETHYFIKLNSEALQYQLQILQRLNETSFPTNTTGPRSLSKSEIIEKLNPILEEILNANE